MFHICGTTLFSDANRRPANQDTGFYINAVSAPDKRASLSLLGVLDGVSGSNGGAAAPAAAEAMQPVLAQLIAQARELSGLELNLRGQRIHSILRDAICTADLCLRRMQAQQGEEYCTTVSLAAVLGDMVYTANVGDSPIYLLRDGHPPAALFRCHNRLEEAVQAGHLTREEGRLRGLGNRLTLMAGGALLSPGEVFCAQAPLGLRSLLLLGSDGALSVLPEEELFALARDWPEEELDDLAEELFRRVEEQGSTDNFTLLAEALSAG